jgi:hypothetical protein
MDSTTLLTSFEEIEQETGYHGCELRIIDLADFASVIAFADKFEKEVGDLHILVMNAGVLQPNYQLTTDGWESMFVYPCLMRELITDIGIQAASQSPCDFVGPFAPYSTTCCYREKVVNTFAGGNCFQ